MPSAIVARLPSSRHADVVYEVKLKPDGTYTCDCPGFSFRKACKHVTAMQELRAQPLEPRKLEEL